MAFKVLTKKYEVNKCFLSTLHYIMGNNSKNDIFLIDNVTTSSLSEYVTNIGDVKRLHIFSICALEKNNGEEGYNCFINLDILSGAIHSFDFSKFGKGLSNNQKLSILICIRFIDALYRNGKNIGNGLSTKECVSRVLTLYEYDNNDRENKLIFNVVNNKPDQFYSYSTLYDVDTEYIESIINKLKLTNYIRIIDDSVKDCILNGYSITPVLKSILPIDGVKILHLKNEKYGFINLSTLDYYRKSTSIKEFRNIMSSSLRLKNEYDDEDINSIYMLYVVLYASYMDLSQHPTEFNTIKNISNHIIGFMNTELVLNEESVLKCIRKKNK